MRGIVNIQLRMLRSGYAAVTQESGVVTQVTQFLGFSAYTCACARATDKKSFLNYFALQTLRNLRNCVTTRVSCVTAA